MAATEAPRRCAVLARALVLLACVQVAGSYSMDDVEFEDDGLEQDMTSMMQMSFRLTPNVEAVAAPAPASSQRDLVMAYVPYNFGHTVAKEVDKMGVKWGDCGSRSGNPSSCIGHNMSSITGCPLMFTPGKYWPKDAAQMYFGSRTVFGILRDPYERLVAVFRGSGRELAPDLYPSCNVSAFVKRTMGWYINSIKSGKPYVKNCKFLPQAEFFDQPYGATVAVDNRRFPASMNTLLTAHGYKDVQIRTEEVEHVSGCDHVWAGDLDPEAKALVRQVYGRDFELLCKHFGYCDALENTCIVGVPGMCPSQFFSWNSEQKVFVQK